MRSTFIIPREKNSAGSPAGEFGFIPKSAMRKTVGLSHADDKENK